MNTKQILLTSGIGFAVAAVVIGGSFFVYLLRNNANQTQAEPIEFLDTAQSLIQPNSITANQITDISC